MHQLQASCFGDLSWVLKLRCVLQATGPAGRKRHEMIQSLRPTWAWSPRIGAWAHSWSAAAMPRKWLATGRLGAPFRIRFGGWPEPAL